MGQVKISLQEATDRQLDQMAAAAKVAKAALVCDLVEEALAPRRESFLPSGADDHVGPRQLSSDAAARLPR